MQIHLVDMIVTKQSASREPTMVVWGKMISDSGKRSFPKGTKCRKEKSTVGDTPNSLLNAAFGLRSKFNYTWTGLTRSYITMFADVYINRMDLHGDLRSNSTPLRGGVVE